MSRVNTNEPTPAKYEPSLEGLSGQRVVPRALQPAGTWHRSDPFLSARWWGRSDCRTGSYREQTRDHRRDRVDGSPADRLWARDTVSGVLVPAACAPVSGTWAARTATHGGGRLGDEAQPNRTSSAGALREPIAGAGAGCVLGDGDKEPLRDG